VDDDHTRAEKGETVNDSYKQENSKGDTYYLHGRQMKNKNGTLRTLYYFGKTINPSRVVPLPDGYEVIEAWTGLLMLRKIRAL
jgi:hypothetical protein